MSDASLNIEFGSTGSNTVKAEIAAVKAAGQELDNLEREWLRAKDARAKEQASIYKAQAAALEERLRQERVAIARERAEELRSTADADRLLESWLKAKDARAKERLAEDRIRSAATRELRRQEAQATQDMAAQEEASWRKAMAAQRAAYEEMGRLRASEKTMMAGTGSAGGPSSSNSSSTLKDWAIYTTGANQALAITQRIVGTVVDVGSALVESAGKWEAYSLVINDIEGDGQVASNTLNDLYNIAKAPGVDYDQASKVYVQLRAVGTEGEKAKQIIREFANATALSGGSSVEFERVNRQLVQMLANGRVLESDLRFMKESMPRLATVMQDVFGTTSAKGIRDLGLSAEEFLDKVMAGLEKLPAATQTLNSELENAGTAWSQLKAAFVDTDFTKGALSAWTDMLEQMTEVLRSKESIWSQLMAKAKENLKGALSMEEGDRSAVNTDPETMGYVWKVNQQLDDENKDIRDKFAKFNVKVHPKGTESSAEEKARKKKEREEARLLKLEEERTYQQYREEAETYNALHRDIRAEQTQERIFRYNQLRARPAEEGILKSQGYNANDLGYSVELSDSFVNADKEVKRSKDAAAKNKALREAKEKAMVEEAEMLAHKYDDEYTLMQDSLAKERAAILTNTELTERQRNEILKKYDDEAMRQRTAFWTSNTSLILTANEDLFGSLAETAKHMTGETSNTYKTLFTISKSFAIADAGLKLGSAIMNAAAAQPWPANMAAMAGVVSATAGVISSINSMAFSGVYDKGGFIPAGKYGIAGERGPEIIQGPAYVTSTNDTAKLLGGKTTVNVHNYAGAAISTREGSDGSLDLIIEAATEAAERRIASGIASGASPVATTMQAMYGLRR